jgi:hypothetical protein
MAINLLYIDIDDLVIPEKKKKKPTLWWLKKRAITDQHWVTATNSLK